MEFPISPQYSGYSYLWLLYEEEGPVTLTDYNDWEEEEPNPNFPEDEQVSLEERFKQMEEWVERANEEEMERPNNVYFCYPAHQHLHKGFCIIDKWCDETGAVDTKQKECIWDFCIRETPKEDCNGCCQSLRQFLWDASGDKDALCLNPWPKLDELTTQKQ